MEPIIKVTSFEEDKIEKTVQDLREVVAEVNSDQSIQIHIDSFGGCIYGLSYLYEELKSIDNPIITYCTSKAMSAGAIVLSACGTKGHRYASPNASIMIHELQTGVGGSMGEIEVSSERLRHENDKWMGILAESMGRDKEKGIRDLVLEKGKGHDIFLSPTEAKDLGIIDHIGYLRITPKPYYKFKFNK